MTGLWSPVVLCVGSTYRHTTVSNAADRLYVKKFSSKLTSENKKVILRECKRHTACRVASTHYAVLDEVPLGPDLEGVPPAQVWMGGTPSGRMGVPPSGPDGGTSSHWWMGYPPVEVWTDTQTVNSTFPHPSDAGGNKEEFTYCFSSVKVQKYFSVLKKVMRHSRFSSIGFGHYRVWCASSRFYVLMTSTKVSLLQALKVFRLMFAFQCLPMTLTR